MDKGGHWSHKDRDEGTGIMARKTIRLTAKMADALGCTIEINGKQAMIMSHPKTQTALAYRKLADEHGYLTDAGRFVAYLISLGSKARAWSQEELEAGTRTWLRDRARDAGKAAPTLEDVELPSDAADREQAMAAARGLSRKPCASTNPTTPTTAKCKSCGLRVADGSEYHESCRPATPKTMPGTIEPATTDLGKPVSDFQVKVWYASGSSETISHIDFMAAASIYGEAEDNPRAIAAEVHCPGGCLAASFTRQPVDTAGERG